MTRERFETLPWLLFEKDFLELTGYARPTLRKMVDCGVLALVKPAGAGHGKLQKVQVAKLLGCAEWMQEQANQWRSEPMLMPEKSVLRWTGYDGKTLWKIGEAGGVVVVRPPGLTGGRYRKVEIGGWIGLRV